MKIKILGIFVIILLITTSLPVVGMMNYERNQSDDNILPYEVTNTDSIYYTGNFGIEYKGIPSTGDGIKIRQKLESVDAEIETIKGSENNGDYSMGNYSIITVGPVLKLFSDVKLQDGPTLKKFLINRNLKRRILRLSAIFPLMIYSVSGLDFTVHYLKDVKNNTRYSFFTDYSEVVYDENGIFVGYNNTKQIFSKAHKITVDNFTGFFAFKRFRFLIPFLAPLGQKVINPARFLFWGHCDKLDVS